MLRRWATSRSTRAPDKLAGPTTCARQSSIGAQQKFAGYALHEIERIINTFGRRL
jgi:hypothetical protein